MTSKTNKAIIRRYVKTGSSNLAFRMSWLQKFRGMLEGYTPCLTTFPDYNVTIEDMIAEGDRLWFGTTREPIRGV
jgi:hypothetical protein